MSFVDDNQKLGFAFCGLGALCWTFGVIFVLQRVLLSIGNLSFLTGTYFLLGFSRFVRFFFRRAKIVGSGAYFGGLFLILIGYVLPGFVLQIYGAWKLFAAFLPNVVQSLKMVPGIGLLFKMPGLRHLADYAYDQRRLPV